MKKIVFVIVVSFFCFLSWHLARNNAQEPLTDWDAAFTRAKNGGFVRLVITDASTPHAEAFSVTLVDGKKEYEVGSSAFYVKNPASFAYDLSPVLKGLEKAPSKYAKIKLTGFNDVEVKYKKISIEKAAAE